MIIAKISKWKSPTTSQNKIKDNDTVIKLFMVYLCTKILPKHTPTVELNMGSVLQLCNECKPNLPGTGLNIVGNYGNGIFAPEKQANKCYFRSNIRSFNFFSSLFFMFLFIYYYFCPVYLLFSSVFISIPIFVLLFFFSGDINASLISEIKQRNL